MNQHADHLALGLEFDQWKLDRLVGRQRFAERRSHLGVGDRFIDAELRRAEAGRGLANAVFIEKVLHDLQAAALTAEDGIRRNPHLGE